MRGEGGGEPMGGEGWGVGGEGAFVEVVFPPSGNSVLVITSFSITLYDSAFFIFFFSSFAIVYYFSASMTHSPPFFQEIL